MDVGGGGRLGLHGLGPSRKIVYYLPTIAAFESFEFFGMFVTDVFLYPAGAGVAFDVRATYLDRWDGLGVTDGDGDRYRRVREKFVMIFDSVEKEGKNNILAWGRRKL